MRAVAEQLTKMKQAAAGGPRRNGRGQWLAPLAIVAILGAALATSPNRSPFSAPPELVAAPGQQVHYLPFDGQQFYDALKSEDTGLPAEDMRLITSIVSSRAGNTVAIDHWEDGYDADPINSPGATTEVSTMGEGQVRVLDNVVVLANIGDVTPGGASQAYYDGRDKIVSTSPTVIAMGGWPNTTGSVHASSSAVPEVSRYGYAFESPVGEDTPFPAGNTAASPWEYTGLIIAASEDGTTVNVTGEAPIALDEGDVHLVDGGINVGDEITSDKPIAVYVAAGDIDAGYEGRLFELTPTERWTDTYFSPVTSTDNAQEITRAFFYNPGSSSITVSVTRSNSTSTSFSVPANGQASYAFPTDVGAKFTSAGNPFYALQAITTPETSGDGSSSWNWGFSLIPEAYLTPMVVVGYGPGYAPGATSNQGNYSGVWVAPAATTTIYVDRDGNTATGANTDANGNHYDFSCTINALVPRIIKDDGSSSCYTPSAYTAGLGSGGDADMTGARIYTLDGTTLAAAWGQIPGLRPGNPAIDMGTTVLPFPTVDLNKTSDIVDDDGDGLADPGETIRYTITATNAGITPVDNLVVTDTIPDHTAYVPDSTIHNGSPIADDASGTPFPLDEGGTVLPPALSVGQTRTVTFDVTVDKPLDPSVTQIVNEAILQTSYGTYTAVDVQKTAPPEPSITMAKTVYAGDDGGVSCQGGDLVYGANGDLVTYCFTITNDGSTALSPVGFSDPDLGITTGDLSGPVGDLDTLDIGESVTLSYVAPIAGDLTNTASVTGTGVDGNGDPIPDVDPVTASDSAAVDEVAPALTTVKTVYLGHDGGALCPGLDTVAAENGTSVTYCFTVTNTGDTHLGPITVDDPSLGVTDADMTVVDGDPVLLAPTESVSFAYETTLDGDLVNTATASGSPTDPNGDPLPGVDPPTDDDTATADELHPDIAVTKSVYHGADAGASCATAGDSITTVDGQTVTYCFTVTNAGDTRLAPVTLVDGDLGADETDMTVVGGGGLTGLDPGESATLYLQSIVAGDLTNTVQATGVPADAGDDPLPGTSPVTAEDSAIVDSVGPAVTVQKTVYAGHDAGAGCEGVETVPVLDGADVTYCFTVTNSGDADLDQVMLTDPDLGIGEDDMVLVGGGTLESLAAGDSASFYYETTASGDLTNTADVVGTPVDGNGDPVPGIDPIHDTDTAQVDVVDPAVSLVKSVYRGHDAGAGCDTAGDVVRNVNGTPVTWCFVVTNDGDVPLNPVSIVDGDLGIDQGDLTVASSSISPLAPGDSATLYLEGTIDGDLLNTASVSGVPTDPGGTPLPGIDPPTGGDTAEVDEVGPAVSVAKSVYAGHDGGAGCPGAELQRGADGAAVTYCFAITNDGDVTLTDLTLADGNLGIDESEVSVVSGDLASLAPGDTVVAYVETVLHADLVNTVDVSGTPVDGDGDPIDTDPPTASDTAEVQLVTPSVAIAKTVYAGHDGGTSCEGGETVVARSGDAVTYCFSVTNNGGATLADVTVDDADLNLTEADLEVASGDPSSLEPGQTVVFYVETAVGDSLVNTAAASGTPLDGDDPLPGGTPPTADDTAEVVVVAPALSVEKTVYRGHDTGAGCDSAGDLAYGRADDDITYCFTVTNTGDTHLAPVSLDDADLGIDQNSPQLHVLSGALEDLAPGDSVVMYVESTVDGDLVNTVDVAGTPADDGGDAFPGLDPATASDTAEVREIDPSVSVQKTVYGGQDAGANCPGGETVAGITGGEVTWCFVVENDGDTPLDGLALADDLLGVDGTDLTQVGGGALPSSLDPGERVTLYFEGVIDGDLDNTAAVTGTPVDDAGDPIPGIGDVSDEDTASVDDQAPHVTVDKGVYYGHDAGADCPGAGSVAVREGADLTYCFTVTNDGESYLSPVTVVDPTLNQDDGDMTVVGGGSLDLLAPGDTVTLYLETTAGPGDVTNTAFATGTPSDDQGDPLPGAQPVQDEDTATVDVVAPHVTVDKTVYRGNDDGQGCAASHESVTGVDGAAVTYCFAIHNDGDTTLAPVTLLDGPLSLTEGDVAVVGGGTLDSLDPGETVVVYAESTITADLVNTVSVSGTPVDGNGDPLPHVPTVSDEDDASVELVAPGVSVAKTVYQGHSSGAGCAGAADAVTAEHGDAVTYCFLVTNEGDTPLDDLALVDADLGVDETDVTVVGGGSLASHLPLAAGDSLTLYVDSSVTGDLTNHVDVTGTPVDEGGDPLPGVDPVTDTDTAVVDEVAPAISIAKTVYRTHDAGVGCNGTDVLAGLQGEDITYCFAVTNTGDTPLVGVTFDDPALTIDETALTVVGPGSLDQLLPDETVVLYYETTIDGDLPNTATVTGTPADGQGDPLPGLPDVSADDTANVYEVAPAIAIAKTVYRGQDDGAGCPGSNLVAGEPGDGITYCFRVHNTGDTALAPVDFSDPTLGITGADVTVVGGGSLGHLDPDETVTVYYETDVTGGDVHNTASVTGHPVDGDGDPLVGVENVSDTDDALVDSVGPAVTIAKTVYAGTDGGASCEGTELVSVLPGDAVTYCFVVTNNGDTPLTPVTVVDDDLGVTDADMDVAGTGSLDRLDPGDSVTLFLQTTVDGDLTNTATATGTPIDGQGQPLGIRDVTDSDTAQVDEVNPSVSVSKTVYKGHDDGAGCAGAESVTAKAGRAVTYCFTVTNDGDTTLAPVTLADVDLGVDQATMTLLDGDLSSLAPGDTATLYVETTVDGDLTNHVTATGTPVDDTSTPLPDVEPVTDTDTASVNEIDPSMTLLTEVQDPLSGEWYDADADGATLGSNDGTPATLRAGDTATFRFTLTNTGDAGISDVLLDAPACTSTPTLTGGDSINAGVLDVGEVWVLTCNVADVAAGFTMDASATADTVDGPPAGSGDHEVADVQVASIALEKTVEDPATGDFVDSATVEPGADVTFRIVVTNDGEVPLADVVVADELGPDCARQLGDTLDPGDSFAAYTCGVADVDEGFVNTAVATATPVDDAGDPVGVDVTDEDPATVAVEAPPVTDLAITKDLVGIDETNAIATWRVTVTNVGDVEATEPIVVTDELAEGLSYRDAGGDGWVCEFAEPTLVCVTDTDLAPGGATSFTVDTYVEAGPDTTVTNVARVDGIEDTNADNNTDDATVDVDSQGVIQPTIPGTLPRTGSDIAGLVATGVLLFFAGFTLRRYGRRKEA